MRRSSWAVRGEDGEGGGFREISELEFISAGFRIHEAGVIG
jgi:hypothetical protein